MAGLECRGAADQVHDAGGRQRVADVEQSLRPALLEPSAHASVTGFLIPVSGRAHTERRQAERNGHRRSVENPYDHAQECM
ncbi:hypothetical protein USDA257_c22580 [Sinorhizobium fredii USDA 257]|uniref:Uncharacterized protein n=1 Tax=Sinorhizobium fredii (strain USDA 257) TaxID=1185652 RepID=I3X4N3_SINF2|nr:hypothetical protein USDA257_c22580 [Sinorhizobium fredii USDA 257]